MKAVKCDTINMDCDEPARYVCECRRCESEPDEYDHFHSCERHRKEADARHQRIRGKPAEWVRWLATAPEHEPTEDMDMEDKPQPWIRYELKPDVHASEPIPESVVWDYQIQGPIAQLKVSVKSESFSSLQVDYHEPPEGLSTQQLWQALRRAQEGFGGRAAKRLQDRKVLGGAVGSGGETVKKKHKYGVTMPIAGSVYVEVEAENSKDAIEKAWDAINEGKVGDDDIVDWEYHEHICEGNVCHASCSDVMVDKVKP